VRLGVYADLVYRRDGDVLSTDRAFVLFATGLAEHVDELVVFGRLAPEPGRAPYALPPGVRFVPFPHYGRVTDLLGVLRSLRGARAAFRRELRELDAVWLFGPYPVSLVLARDALRARTPLFLGVRQDFPAYVRNRLPSRRWAWAVAVAQGFELLFRRLARKAPAVVVGEELGRAYGSGGAKVLVAGFSLIRRDDVVPAGEALARPWDGERLRLLTVGRIDAEKNPLLLPEILAGLRRLDPRWELTVVGEGALEQRLRERARELGVADSLHVRGYVANGPELWALYREANAFIHVSFTEGLPQVLFEAAAAGTPVVATAVGGVAAGLGGGERGLLVPPDDAAAAVAALERLRAEPELRERFVRAGLAHADATTMDAQLARIAAFFRDDLAARFQRT